MREYQQSMPLFDPPIVPPTLNVTVEAQDVPRLTRSLIRLLKTMGTRWWSASELRNIAGWRFGARLRELKECGFPHAKQRIKEGKGEFEYRLIPSPTNGLMEEQ